MDTTEPGATPITTNDDTAVPQPAAAPSSGDVSPQDLADITKDLKDEGIEFLHPGE